MNRFGATNRDENGKLPLHHAVKLGLSWNDGLSAIVDVHREALGDIDEETDLALLPIATSRCIMGEAIRREVELEEETGSEAQAEETRRTRTAIREIEYLNSVIILNPNTMQAQSSYPTISYLKKMHENTRLYQNAKNAEKNKICKDIVEELEGRGYYFCHCNIDETNNYQMVAVPSKTSVKVGYLGKILATWHGGKFIEYETKSHHKRRNNHDYMK